MAATRVLEQRNKAILEPAPEVDAIPIAPVRQSWYLGFQVLRFGFVIALLMAGVHHLTTNLELYIADSIERRLPMSPHAFIQLVGVLEILAAILVAIVPRIGAWVVAAGILSIIVNLLLIPGFHDVACRDLGLFFGAIALGLVAREFGAPGKIGEPVKTQAVPGGKSENHERVSSPPVH
jgi:hypothetical protein